MTVTFVRTDEPGPMHEVALNLVCTDFDRYVDVYGSAVLIGPGLALTARHNVEIFRANYERARGRGEAGDAFAMIAAQTWLDPPATIMHRVRKWFSAPWTDLAVLSLAPANDPPDQIPSNYRWRGVALDLAVPATGSAIAAFGFDQVEVTREEASIQIRARGATTTGVVQEVLDPLEGNAHHGWPRFQTNSRFDGGMSGGPVMNPLGRACGVVSLSLPATLEHEEHASFVPLLWPAMAIEVDDPRDLANELTLLDLARAGVLSVHGHELIDLTFGENGRVNGVRLRHE